MFFFVDLYAGAATQNMKTWWEALILFYVLIGEFMVFNIICRMPGEDQRWDIPSASV